MELEEYSTFEEKMPYFVNGGFKIDENSNINGVFSKLKEFQTKGTGFIYRGVPEAKFRLYNSAQRVYMTKDLHINVPVDSIQEHYNEFIESAIENCKIWNNGVIKQLLKNGGVDPQNSLAYLSYMQHYGAPTPLLDYSFNPYIALFFSLNKEPYCESEVEIENYLSLYYSHSESNTFDTWKYVFDNNLKKEGILYETVSKNDLSILLPDNELYKIINNANIINQEGLFFYNNHPWYPLEQNYSEYVKFMKKEVGERRWRETLMLDTVSGCFNIHKKLIPKINEKLISLGITEDYIYPNMTKFKENITEKAISKSKK
ncbi:FRG domain-containing protein [Mariniflexile jejuense]|uniref:FRG domain-containing protein n=1 Tax=Mariniflexile jejuense TaxID=1173582 RepID=A0ABW3JLU8_9FLAO